MHYERQCHKPTSRESLQYLLLIQNHYPKLRIYCVPVHSEPLFYHPPHLDTVFLSTLFVAIIDPLVFLCNRIISLEQLCLTIKSSGKFKYMTERHGGSSSKGSLTGTGVLSLQIWKNAKSPEAKKD